MSQPSLSVVEDVTTNEETTKEQYVINYLKSMVALVVAEVVTLLNGVAHTTLGDDPFVWTTAGLSGLGVWLLSMGWNALGKSVVKTVS